MPQNSNRESMMFSLFSAGKKNQEAKNKIEQEHQQEQEIVKSEEIKLPEVSEKVPIVFEGSWERIIPTMEDIRIDTLQIYVSTDKMQVKMRRVQAKEEFASTDQELSQRIKSMEDAMKEQKIAAENIELLKEAGEKVEHNEDEFEKIKQLGDLEKDCKTIELETKIKELNATIAKCDENAPNLVELKSELATLQAELEEHLNIKEVKFIERELIKTEWDIDFLHAIIKDVKVTHGVIEGGFEQLLLPVFQDDILVAEGTYAVNGTDAVVHEFFPRESAPKFETRPDGSIDFKNMHLVTNVEQGTIIAERIPPKVGEPGKNVFGGLVMPRQGAILNLQRGENTDVVPNPENPNITNLIAKVQGNLVFRKGAFCVDSVYRVEGNVDNSTGNIDFNGDVIVKGDVLEGYTVRSKGSISVLGMVEGASLYASGDIRLEKGINGMSKGILEAGKSITAKFIENCTVCADGNITCESIINSQVECNANVSVTGKGLISGGKCTVFGSISAKILGSRSSTPSTIVLGITPRILKERNDIENQYQMVCADLEEIKKNINYVTAQTKSENVKQAEQIIATLNGKLSIATLKKQRFEQLRAAIIEEMSSIFNCVFTCDTAYPPARITIGSATLVLKETQNMCRFYRNDAGEVAIGKK